VLAAADSPSFTRLKDRLLTAGVEVEQAAGSGRAAPAIRLKFGDLKLDTSVLDRQIDVGRILTNKEEKPLERKEWAVGRCVEFALLSQNERDRRLTELHRGKRGTLAAEEEMHRAEYARLAVAAVRSGAAPDWKKIDDKILGLPRVSDRGNDWLVTTAGVTKWNQIELGVRTQSLSRPVPAFGTPDRGLTRNTPDSRRDGRNNRPTGGGGSGGRGR
jgi:hypothetical protein